MKYLVLYCFLPFSIGISFLSFDLSVPAPRSQEIIHQSCRNHPFPPSFPPSHPFSSCISASHPFLFISLPLPISAYPPTTYPTHHPHPPSLSAHHHRCGVTRSNRLIITALHIHTRTRHHTKSHHDNLSHDINSNHPNHINQVSHHS